MTQTIFERVMDLASEPKRRVVLLTFHQVRELRSNFTLGEWTEFSVAAQTDEADPLDRAKIGNCTIRYKEPPPDGPEIIDLTKETGSW